MSLIVINMVIFMAHVPRQDPDIVILFENINLIFLIIFIIEATLKLLCMGKLYFKDPYNVFDFAILSITLVSMALSAFKIIESNN